MSSTEHLHKRPGDANVTALKKQIYKNKCSNMFLHMYSVKLEILSFNAVFFIQTDKSKSTKSVKLY